MHGDLAVVLEDHGRGMHLHRVMMLDGDMVLVGDLDRGAVEGFLGVATRAGHRLDAGALLLRLVGLVPVELHIRGVHRGLIFHLHQRGGVAGDAELFRYHERHRLAAIDDLLVIEGAERRAGRRDFVLMAEAEPCRARPVFMCKHLQHAGHGERRLDVDGGDAAFGNGARDHVSIAEVRGGELARVFRRARDFCAAVDAAARRADMGFVGQHGGPQWMRLSFWDCGVPAAA